MVADAGAGRQSEREEPKRPMDVALVIPLANEEATLGILFERLGRVLDGLGSGTVYFVVDRASKDNTLEVSRELCGKDKRFVTVWAPENRNVVDAYMKGYRVACDNCHDAIIEMDGGLSHEPEAIPAFIEALDNGWECVFGSRFVKGGAMHTGSLKRLVLSKFGTVVSNFFLGTKLKDMTSGYEAFRTNVVRQFLEYPLLSTGHFFQTELRYLLRKKKWIEVPIRYNVTTSHVPMRSVANSLYGLWHYFKRRLMGRPAIIE
jgi:dolichol-phosphate mannosyltransferase